MKAMALHVLRFFYLILAPEQPDGPLINRLNGSPDLDYLQAALVGSLISCRLPSC